MKSLVVEVHKASTCGRSDNLLDEQSIKSAEAFLKGLRGMVFYAVPHGGANMGEIYKLWSVEGKFRMAGISKNVEPFQRKMESLSKDFDNVALRKSLKVYAFGEAKPMEEVGFAVPYSILDKTFLHDFR